MVLLRKSINKIYYRFIRKKPQPNEENRPSDMWGRVFDLTQKKLVHLENFNLYVMPNDYIGHHILQTKNYEPHITQLIKKILHINDVFLDIGANIGYFTMLASSLVKEGKVIAIEPNPQNLQLIYSSMEQHESKNIEVYPYAISNVKTIFHFTNVGSNGGIVTQHSKDQTYYFLVQSAILDDLLKDEPKINLIKMDIEAHEPYALLGMIGLIKKHQPKIITEFHPWAMQFNNPEDPIDFLNNIINLGYQISIITPNGKLDEVSNTKDIISYWKSFNEVTMHLDLFAEPH